MMKKIKEILSRYLIKILFVSGYTAGLLRQLYSRRQHLKKINLGFIVEEFFHEELRGFGGFGKTVKNISDHFNAKSNSFKIKVLVSQGLPIAPRPMIRQFHNADVLLRSRWREGCDLPDFFSATRLIHKMGIDTFITIDYYSSYEHYLLASPQTPVIVWIKDPRDKLEWEKLASVPSELILRKKHSRDELVKLAFEKEESIKRILRLSKRFKRKIIFATNAHFLVERAERTYGVKIPNPYFLVNPILESPAIGQITHSQKASLLYIGRLEPVKRPWIVFELAKKFSEVDFLYSGNSQHPRSHESNN